mgnify:CR=1 FL=1
MQGSAITTVLAVTAATTTQFDVPWLRQRISVPSQKKKRKKTKKRNKKNGKTKTKKKKNKEKKKRKRKRKRKRKKKQNDKQKHKTCFFEKTNFSKFELAYLGSRFEEYRYYYF